MPATDTLPFTPRDFVDGSAPGSDPYDNPRYPRIAHWSSSRAKADGANAVVEFLLSDHSYEQFSDTAYDALSHHMFGHVAEFTRHGFYHAWLSTPQQRARFVSRALARDFADLTRSRLWGDVERAIVTWLRDSGVGEQIIAEGAAATEREERATLADLIAKYGAP